MDNMNKIRNICCLICILFVMVPGTGRTADEPYDDLKAGFKNFIECELTRTDAVNHFQGKEFTVAMVNLFDVTSELDLTILTGAVKCDVQGKYQTMYVALGVRESKGKKVVSYFTIRHKDFRILATELMRHPYKERCPWARYWISPE